MFHSSDSNGDSSFKHKREHKNAIKSWLNPLVRLPQTQYSPQKNHYTVCFVVSILSLHLFFALTALFLFRLLFFSGCGYLNATGECTNWKTVFIFKALRYFCIVPPIMGWKPRKETSRKWHLFVSFVCLFAFLLGKQTIRRR